MDIIKPLIVMILATGLMGLLGLIVIDEFMMANEHGGALDANVVELLQMSITGIVGIVAGYLSGNSTPSKGKGCNNPDCKCG